MKKGLIVLIMAFLVFTFAACSGNNADKSRGGADLKLIKNSKLLKNYETEKLPKEYTQDIAEGNGDVVVNTRGDSSNTDKFMKFVGNVNKKTKDKVRITSFTTEGGAVIQDLSYDGKKILLISDTTRDGFGIREVRQYNVSKIEKTQDSYDALINGQKYHLISIQ